jgi:hypothetical protein
MGGSPVGAQLLAIFRLKDVLCELSACQVGWRSRWKLGQFLWGEYFSRLQLVPSMTQLGNIVDDLGSLIFPSS